MTYTGHNLDQAIAEVRAKMQRTNPVDLHTVSLAEDYARHIRKTFAERDLALVAEALLVSAGSLGWLLTRSGPIDAMATFSLNVQSVAAVLILDELTMAAHESERPRS